MVKLNEQETKVAELLMAGKLTEDMLALILSLKEFNDLLNRCRDKLTYKATAIKSGVSVERTRQRCTRACRIINKFINNDYITIRKIDCRTVPVKPRYKDPKPKVRRKRVDPEFKNITFNVTYADLPLPIKRAR